MIAPLPGLTGDFESNTDEAVVERAVEPSSLRAADWDHRRLDVALLFAATPHIPVGTVQPVEVRIDSHGAVTAVGHYRKVSPLGAFRVSGRIVPLQAE